MNTSPQTLATRMSFALSRLQVGLSSKSTPDCDHYDGILDDAVLELKTVSDLLAPSVNGELRLVLDICLPDHFEADSDDEQAAWNWIETASAFTHVDNARDGTVWECLVHVEHFRMRLSEPIPDSLKAFFDDAMARGCRLICFHQG